MMVTLEMIRPSGGTYNQQLWAPPVLCLASKIVFFNLIRGETKYTSYRKSKQIRNELYAHEIRNRIEVDIPADQQFGRRIFEKYI